MRRDKIFAYAFLHAVAAALYIGGVAWFMTSAERFLPAMPDVFGVMVFLILFVVSAAVTGGLVLGRPIFWYFSGARREAFTLAVATIVFLLFIALGVLAIGRFMIPA